MLSFSRPHIWSNNIGNQGGFDKKGTIEDNKVLKIARKRMQRKDYLQKKHWSTVSSK